MFILRSPGVGTPVLDSDRENLSAEVLADGVGWVFRTGDAAALAAELDRLRQNPGLAADLRPAARSSYSARYSPVLDLGRLEMVYRLVADSD